MGIATFAGRLGIDSGPDWGIRRIIALGLGIGLFTTSTLFYISKLRNLVNYDKLNKISKYIDLSIAYCLVTIGLIEIVLRITYFNPSIYQDRTNWFGIIPRAKSIILWGKEGYALTHYDGLGEIHTPFTTGENILVLGDSITEAWQVNDNYKFASISEDILHNDGFNINIRNFGRSSLSVADYVSWIPLYIKLYDPRVIVLQLWENDFIESFQRDQLNYFIDEENNKLTLINQFDLNKSLNNSHIGPKLSPVTFSYGKNRFEDLITQDQQDQNMVIFEMDLAKQQMEQLLISCNGTKLILLLVPPTPTISGKEIEFQSVEYDKFKEFFNQFPGVVILDPLPEFNEIILDGHFPWGFMNSPNPSNGHLNRLGNEIVGKLIAEAIEKVLP